MRGLKKSLMWISNIEGEQPLSNLKKILLVVEVKTSDRFSLSGQRILSGMNNTQRYFPTKHFRDIFIFKFNEVIFVP